MKKRFKYFGRAYDEAQDLIDRLIKDFAAINVSVVYSVLAVIDYRQAVIDPLFGTTSIEGRSPPSWRFEVKCLVHPLAFHLIDFRGPWKVDGADCLDPHAGWQVNMEFECHDGQPFEKAALFLMQNNHLPAWRRSSNLGASSV
jgi:hypothetical protein